MHTGQLIGVVSRQ